MGSDDTNDATTYSDCYNETDANLIWDVLGERYGKKVDKYPDCI